MEVSALKYPGGIGLHGRIPLLRLQSDERLIAYLRKGNMAAFEVLVARYESRLLAFCRHLLGSREDAEDVMQEVMTAAFNAILADDRPINVRPWLYRIARNRSLNHLRRIQTIGVDTMDMHFSDNGESTADKVHDREEFRLLVGDIHELPETQKTALVLREMDALSYEQIAEAMETTVPSVKSLLVRARVSLAEAAEARVLSCEEVRIELGEIAEGLRRRPSPLVRRHLRSCKRCSAFRGQLRDTNKALAALMPIGPLVILKKLAFAHLGHSAGAGSGAAGSGAAGAGAASAGATGAGATAGGTALAGSGVAASSSGVISAGIGALATKAAAGLAAAALVTAGAVEAGHVGGRVHHHHTAVAAVEPLPASVQQAPATPLASQPEPQSSSPAPASPAPPAARAKTDAAKFKDLNAKPTVTKTHKAAATATAPKPQPTTTSNTPTTVAAVPPPVNTPATVPGRDQTQQAPSVMPPTGTPLPTSGESGSTQSTTAAAPDTTPTGTGTTSTTPTTTSTTPTTTTTTTPTTTTPTTTTTTPTTTTPPPSTTPSPSTTPPPVDNRPSSATTSSSVDNRPATTTQSSPSDHPAGRESHSMRIPADGHHRHHLVGYLGG